MTPQFQASWEILSEKPDLLTPNSQYLSTQGVTCPKPELQKRQPVEQPNEGMRDVGVVQSLMMIRRTQTLQLEKKTVSVLVHLCKSSFRCIIIFTTIQLPYHVTAIIPIITSR